MTNELVYVLLGIGLLLFGSRIKDDSPASIMNIWGMVLVLTGIGFFGEFVPTSSFLPFTMISSVIFFKGTDNWMKPMFFIFAVLILSLPIIGYMDPFFSSSMGPVLTVAVFGGCFVALVTKTREKRAETDESRNIWAKTAVETILRPKPVGVVPGPKPVETKSGDIWGEA